MTSFDLPVEFPLVFNDKIFPLAFKDGSVKYFVLPPPAVEVWTMATLDVGTVLAPASIVCKLAAFGFWRMSSCAWPGLLVLIILAVGHSTVFAGEDDEAVVMKLHATVDCTVVIMGLLRDDESTILKSAASARALMSPSEGSELRLPLSKLMLKRSWEESIFSKSPASIWEHPSELRESGSMTESSSLQERPEMKDRLVSLRSRSTFGDKSGSGQEGQISLL